MTFWWPAKRSKGWGGERRLTPSQNRLNALGGLTVLTIATLTAQIIGVAVNVIIFAAAGFNYADFANASDVLTSAFKSPVALVFGLFSVFYALMMFATWKSTTTKRASIAFGILSAIVVTTVILNTSALILAVSTAGIGKRWPDGHFWWRLMVGVMPHVDLQSTDPGVQRLISGVDRIQLLSRAGNHLLLLIDDKPTVIRADKIDIIGRAP